MVSVVIPVYNGGNTIKKTLESLLSQQDFFNELIIVDDYSKDNAVSLIENFLSQKSINYKIIRHQKNQGLAASYNTGIKSATGDIVVFAHQDVELYENALAHLIAPFQDKGVAAVSHYTYQPLGDWQKLNFWQKYFFCRWVNKKVYGINGKFDAFRREALLIIGLFDEQRFKTAGEDGDLLIRISGQGKIMKAEAGIIHQHQFEDNFGWKNILAKQAQLSEAQGALFKKHGLKLGGLCGLAQAFFREILLIGIFIPFINILCFGLIVFYCLVVSYQMFFYEYKNWRVYLLPFLNFSLFFVSLIFSARGFLTGRQEFH